MRTRLVPVRERLLVQKDPPAERIGSLFVPETAKKAQTIGTVIAAGPGYFAGTDAAGSPVYTPTGYGVGDRVVTGEWSGIEVSVDGETLWLLTPDEIHAKVEEGTDARA